MVDGDVYVSVMAFSLHQQQWPPICVNNDGLNKKVLMMASWAHSAHRHQFVGEATWPRNFLEGSLVCNEKTLGMATINKGVSQGMLTGSGNGVLGIHRQASTRDDA